MCKRMGASHLILQIIPTCSWWELHSIWTCLWIHPNSWHTSEFSCFSFHIFQQWKQSKWNILNFVGDAVVCDRGGRRNSLWMLAQTVAWQLLAFTMSASVVVMALSMASTMILTAGLYDSILVPKRKFLWISRLTIYCNHVSGDIIWGASF
jgi:hypothetical protein